MCHSIIVGLRRGHNGCLLYPDSPGTKIASRGRGRYYKNFLWHNFLIYNSYGSYLQIYFYAYLVNIQLDVFISISILLNKCCTSVPRTNRDDVTSLYFLYRSSQTHKCHITLVRQHHTWICMTRPHFKTNCYCTVVVEKWDDTMATVDMIILHLETVSRLQLWIVCCRCCCCWNCCYGTIVILRFSIFTGW